MWGSISDIAEINPETTNSSWKGREILYIDISSVGFGTFKSEPERILYDEAPSRARRIVRHGDILISTVRPNRRSMVQIMNPLDNTVASTGFALLRPKRIEDSHYLFGIVSNKQFTLELEMLAYGAAYPAVSIEDICKPAVYLPNEKIRDEMSKPIKYVSNLIRANTSSTIQKMISSIFRSWFIDFEPMKMKSDEKTSNKSKEKISSLFPDTYDESAELGQIPKGWSIEYLSDLFDIQRGFSYSSEALCEFGGGIAMINLASFIEGGGYKHPGLKYISSDFNDKFLIKSDDIFIATVDLTPGLRVVGSPLIAPKFLDNKSIFSQDLLRLRKKQSGKVGRGFLYNWLKIRRGILKQWSSGTTVSRFPPAALDKYPVLVPPKELMSQFEFIFEKAQEIIEKTSQTEKKLSSLLESLLPRLMAGQLINDINKPPSLPNKRMPLDSNQRKRLFKDLCEIVTKYREDQHRFREHTWSAVSVDAHVSETIGAIVFGQKGHGQRGQQKNNLAEGEVYRGDYLLTFKGEWNQSVKYNKYDVISYQDKFYECLKTTSGKTPGESTTDTWEEIIEPSLGLPKECKKADKVYPNIDFILHGKLMEIDELQLIKIDEDKTKQSTMEQMDPKLIGIHHGIQSSASSIQLLKFKDDVFYGENILGKTTGTPLIKIKEGKLWKWNKEKGENGDYVEKDWGKDNFLSKAYLVKKILEEFGNINRPITKTAAQKMTKTQIIKKLNEIGYEVKPEDGSYLLMNKNKKLTTDRTDIKFIMRQDDGHFNFGKTTKKKMKAMLEDGFALIHHHHDCLGRVSVAVMLLKPDEEKKNKILEKWENDTKKFQPNIRLFGDCIRDELYASEAWGLESLGAELVAYAVQQPDGFKVLHWGEQLELNDPKAKKLLTGLPEGLCEMPIEPIGFELDWDDDAARQSKAKVYFDEVIVKFYRDMEKFTEETNTAKNIGFGHTSEHMNCLWSKLRGCRSNARGTDAWDEDDEVCEIKSQCGCIGDAMGSQHKKGTIHLNDPGEDGIRIKKWKKLFVNLLSDRTPDQHGKSDKPLFHFKILGPKENTMQVLEDHAEKYSKHPHTGTPDLQYYPENEYESDKLVMYYGKKSECMNEGILEFEVLKEFVEGE